MKSATDGSSKWVGLSTSLISLFIITSLANAAGVQPRDDKMSVMGKRAAAAVARVNAAASGAGRPTARAHDRATTVASTIRNAAKRTKATQRPAPGGQAELSIAVDESGQHVVIGFNDTRGFAKNPISVSGFLYSEDGGKTFVDGGQLPSPGNEVDRHHAVSAGVRRSGGEVPRQLRVRLLVDPRSRRRATRPTCRPWACIARATAARPGKVRSR